MKAKDLRGKNIEDIQNDDPKEDEDAVAAAYENISKRLESIRGGKASEDEDEASDSRDEKDEEPKLTEWKGPRPPKEEELKPMKDFDEEEDQDLRKVKLDNTPGKKHEEEEDEIDPLDDEGDDDEEEDEKPAKKEWEPEENDPLDDEEEEDKPSGEEKEEDESEMHSMKSDVEETAVADEPVGREKEQESLHSEIRRPDVSAPEDLPSDVDQDRKGPDTLDDLAQESPFGRHEVESSKSTDPEELPYYRNPGEEDQEDDYSIPNLRGSRQNGADMGYNAHPQRESIGQSYSPRGNMDGNDPNNFFSQHQAPKRANKFHLLILIIIGIVVIGFTVYILKGGFGGISIGTASPSPSPSAAIATPEPTPTPTPEPEVERGEFTVKVLNGTSTSGLARTVSDKLKETGYKTAAPGNAADDDIEHTEIRVKEGSESAALFERLKLDLAPDYDAVQGEALDEKTAHDAEVIIGAK